MKHKVKISPLIKEVELRKTPVVIRVNKFNEEAAKKFAAEIIWKELVKKANKDNRP